MAPKCSAAKVLSLRSGTDYAIEEEANRLLAQSKADGESADWLSQDQLDLRQSREIGNSIGVADASLVAGIYRRSYNPLAGTRPGRLGRSHDDG